MSFNNEQMYKVQNSKMQTTKGRQSKILLEGQTRCGDTVDIMLTGKEAQETWKMNKHMKSKGETQAMWLLNK